MQKILTGLLLLAAFGGRSQTSDTVEVRLDHLELQDVVIIDTWKDEHAIKPSTDDHQLELQLKGLKGINLISRGTFAQEVMYRGQADGRIQVKLNGMRIYSACTDRMDPSTSYVVANNLKSAEVSSACESHCSNAGLAGNLNLEIKVPTFDKEQKWRAGILQQYQSNTRGFNTAVNLENNTDKLAWRINGSWQHNNNYSAGGGKVVEYSQNQKQNWAFNGVYRLAPKQFLKLDFIYDLARNVGYPALPMDVGRARAVIAGLTYNSYRNLGPFARFDLKLYHNDIYHEMDDTQREDVFMHMDMPGWSRTTGLTLDAHDWRAGKHTLSASAEYYTNFRKAEMTMYPNEKDAVPMYMLTWPDSRLHGVGVGIADAWHFGNSMVNTIVRVDYETSSLIESMGRQQWEGMGYDGKSRSFILPKLRLALTHQLNDANALNCALGYGMRGGTTSELYGFYLFNASDGFDYLGNPQLEPEKLLTAELGHTLKKSRYEITSAVFLQQYFDYIFGVNTSYAAMTYGGRGVREYQNIGPSTFWGVEAGAKYLFTKSVSATAELEYLRGFRPQEDLPLVPPLQASLGLDWRYHKFTFLLKGRLAADQPHYNSKYGDRYTPGYALADFAVNYQASVKKIQVKAALAVNNLFDTYYRDHLSWGGIPAMGRNVILKLQLSR